LGVVRAIGLMSGTSLDGVDVALIETDGERIDRFGPTGYRPYADDEQTLLRQALAQGVALTDRAARPGVLAEADDFVTRVHAETVEAFLDTEHIDKSDVAIIGFHGQTVLHRPGQRLTVQIGDGKALARRLGIPVAYDFRAADVAAGGQGAPLVPVFHQALARDLDRAHPIAVLNVGGVANVTFVDGGDPIACDTGPGNALIDDFMRARTGAPLDRDGDQASKGRVDEAFVERVLADGFFGLPYKKIARPQCFRLCQYWAAGLFRRRRRGDLVGADRGSGRAYRAAFAGAAARLDRGGRGRAQSDADADAGGAAETGDGGDRRRGRLVVAIDRSAGLCLSGGAVYARPDAHISRHDRRGAAAAGRNYREAMTVRPRSACGRS